MAIKKHDRIHEKLKTFEEKVLTEKYFKNFFEFGDIQDKSVEFRERNAIWIEIWIDGEFYTDFQIIHSKEPMEEDNFIPGTSRKVTKKEWEVINYWKSLDWIDVDNEITYSDFKTKVLDRKVVVGNISLTKFQIGRFNYRNENYCETDEGDDEEYEITNSLEFECSYKGKVVLASVWWNEMHQDWYGDATFEETKKFLSDDEYAELSKALETLLDIYVIFE